MRSRTLFIAGCAVTTMFVAGGNAQPGTGSQPLTVGSMTLTIEGTSKRAPFSASTKTVRVTDVQLAGRPSGDVLQQVLQPGGLAAFEVAIPVMTLTSPDQGVEEHIHDSLKAEEHPEIRFRLRGIKNGDGEANGAIPLRANGTLTIAGVDREVTLDIKALRTGAWLMVNGTTDLLMTDFGVKPPKGILGMLSTDPTVRVRFYLMLTATEDR